MIFLIFVSKSFLINSILPTKKKKNYQTVEKKQLLIILPFLGHLYFETRNRLKNCIRNQLPSCSLSIAFQSKTRLSIIFKFKESIPKYLCSCLIYKVLCSWCNATYYGEFKETVLCTSLGTSGNHSTDIETDKKFQKVCYYGPYFIRRS